MHLQQKQRSFLTFGFSANNSSPTSTNSSSNQNNQNGSNHQQLTQSPLPKSSNQSTNNQPQPANNNVSLSNISSIGGLATNNSSNNSNGNSNQNGSTNTSDAPEIRKYKKRFNSEILSASLWGVNLLIGTENGLMLLDRSGQGTIF